MKSSDSTKSVTATTPSVKPSGWKIQARAKMSRVYKDSMGVELLPCYTDKDLQVF